MHVWLWGLTGGRQGLGGERRAAKTGESSQILFSGLFLSLNKIHGVYFWLTRPLITDKSMIFLSF